MSFMRLKHFIHDCSILKETDNPVNWTHPEIRLLSPHPNSPYLTKWFTVTWKVIHMEEVLTLSLRVQALLLMLLMTLLIPQIKWGKSRRPQNCASRRMEKHLSEDWLQPLKSPSTYKLQVVSTLLNPSCMTWKKNGHKKSWGREAHKRRDFMRPYSSYGFCSCHAWQTKWKRDYS